MRRRREHPAEARGCVADGRRAADGLLSPNFVGGPGGLGERFKGPTGAKEFIGRPGEGFPDITFMVEDMIGDGDLVAIPRLAIGTHDGEVHAP